MIQEVVQGHAFKVQLRDGNRTEVVVIATDAIEAGTIVRDRFEGTVVSVEHVAEIDLIDAELLGEEMERTE